MIKTRKAVIRKIFFISLFFCSTANQAFPNEKANRQVYLNSLSNIYNGMKAVEFNKDICASLYPKFAKDNTHAYSTWQAQHVRFLQEFEKRYSNYLHNLSGNNSQKYRQYIKIMNGKFDEKKLIRQAELKHMPANKSQLLCKNYPNLIASELNPEKLYAKDIEVVRKYNF